MTQKLFVLAFVLTFPFQFGYASESSRDLTQKIQQSLQNQFPTAQIRLPNLDQLAASDEVSQLGVITQVRVVEERGNSVALLDLTSADGKTIRIQTPYQALVKVPVALRRVFPNSKVKKDDYRMTMINIAQSPAKEYRGVMIMDELRLENTETKQTILEGQYFVSNAIQKSPDLRKGETVKLMMNSGDLSLSTAATILENASIGENVKVMTAKTKRELSGKVLADHSVEVSL